MTSPTTTSSTRDLGQELQLIEVKPGLRFSLATLRSMLPDTETVLFFGKVYKLDAMQLADTLLQVLNTDLAQALFGEGAMHSNELQTYLVGGYVHEDHCDGDTEWGECICTPYHYDGIAPTEAGQFKFDTNAPPPQGEILPQVWESLEVEIADSIAAVVEKLDGVLDRLPGKKGEMVFQTLAKMNRLRPTIGQHQAAIHHPRVTENLVILDVSGSMTEGTVRQIIDDVVALSYKANAHLVIVSNTATHWTPGTYDTDVVLKKAEYGGTRYEQLVPLLNEDWGTVITIADYDSSRGAKEAIARTNGRIGQVLDISLVNRPTFLAECVGQRADEVRPILIASSSYVLRD